MRFRRRTWIAFILASVVVLVLPRPTLACTGETVPLADILRTAEAIVVAEIVDVREPTWDGDTQLTEWRHTFRVDRVLAGRSEPEFTLDGSIRTAVCDGLIGDRGDRIVMAVRAIGFFQTMYPYWPLAVQEPISHPGARDDLEQLLAFVGPIRASSSQSAGPDVWLIAVVIAAVAIAAMALFLVDPGRGRRIRSNDP
jgi:hypothetical protein